jgi:hypothetical protein
MMMVGYELSRPADERSKGYCEKDESLLVRYARGPKGRRLSLVVGAVMVGRAF